MRRANGKNIEFSQKKPIGSVQKNALSENSICKRYGSEAGEELERHLDQGSGRVSRRELEKQKQEMKRLRYRNAAYVLFLTVAFAVTSVMLISYIRMESSITQSVKQVAALQSQLNNLKTENDEMKNRIDSSINLEEIRRIAITELGMTYAGQGQIVEIPDDGSDYVRQYADIKK